MTILLQYPDISLQAYVSQKVILPFDAESELVIFFIGCISQAIHNISIWLSKQCLNY